MKRKLNYFLGALLVAAFIAWVYSNTIDDEEEFSETVKVSLRDVGNELLLANNDSTTLVLPILKLDNNKYQLSFEEKLAFEPGRLLINFKNSFQKYDLPKFYRVEVIQCEDHEVAYSYEIKMEAENDIIPCSGRILPEGCYLIEVKFTKLKVFSTNKKLLLYLLIGIFTLLMVSIFYKRKQLNTTDEKNPSFEALGSYQFYPEQNKLVKKAIEISLSKKECELLEILVANSNQIVKRDELTKRIWEDNGVIVGRSLDTYISKLRKKLKDDASIKITNVHGVGYKLEISNKS
tara:strand:- start:120 stop:992 length:873 start_codon:yes stop_codon:yes gene_type:complete